MVRQASLVTDLETIVGKPWVREGDELLSYAVDGLNPQVAVEPGSYEEVRATINYANGARLAVIPRGGGTSMHMGNIAERYDLALSVSRLDGIIEHEPADLTITVPAGVTLGRLREHLAASGQMVAIDPALPDQATVGGVLAANAFGASRHAYGTARDFTIGLRVVTGDGKLTRTGGKVVKNVAGYDLTKLYIGSLGTLGVIVEATFKVRPLPKAEKQVSFIFPDGARAHAVALQMQSRGLSVASLELLNAVAAGLASGAALSVRLAGPPSAVEHSERETQAAAEEAGGQRAHVQQLAPDAEALVARISVLPSQVPRVISALDERLPGAAVVAYPTVGSVRVLAPADADVRESLERLRTLAAASVVIERCAPELKREIDVFGEPPPGFELMRRIKEQWDPNRVMSPGRFVGKL